MWGEGNGEVALFADTFNTYFEPENLRDAVEVLSGLGYRVVPLAAAEGGRPLCCGRTFLSAGLVEEARAEARRLLAAARPFVERGVPIVGLEPSCLFTLRDELPAMLPGEEADALAGQALLIEELLAREAAAGRIPKSIARAPGKVVLHGHCHQKAFGAMGAVTAALGLVEGLEVETVEFELLRHGGRLRLRRRHPRGLPRHGRALPAAGRAPGTCRGDHRRRRLLLPPPDPRRHRPHPAARRAHPAPRHGRGRCNTTPLTIDAIATFGGPAPRGRPRGGQVGSPPIANNHCPCDRLRAGVRKGFVGGTMATQAPRNRGADNRVTRSSLDIGGGLFLLGLAIVGYVGGFSLPFGQLSGIGSGLLPKVVALLVAAFGVALLVQGFLSDGDKLDQWAIRGPIFVLSGVIVFAFTIRPLGLVVAGPLAVIVSALADKDTRPVEVAILALALTVASGLMFKELLSLPIPFDPRGLIPEPVFHAYVGLKSGVAALFAGLKAIISR